MRPATLQRLFTQCTSHSSFDEWALIPAFRSFWLFQGGSGEWGIVLDIAREWLAQTPMITHDTPVVPLIEQDDKSQFASRATMVRTRALQCVLN